MRLLSILAIAGLVCGTACGDTTSEGGGGANGGHGGGDGAAGGEGGTGALGPGFSCDDSAGTPPSLTLTQIVDDSALDGLVQIEGAPGNPDRLFVVVQSGQIRIVENGALLPDPFIDISDVLQSGGEEGLLGLAFHPKYLQNGRFFVHYSAAGSGDSTVMEYEVSDDPLVADDNPVQLVVQRPTEQSNHNGGAVEFGNDGYLYISMGDGGEQTDPGCDAMNPDKLLGKITRVDVDGTPDDDGYPAAPGNPDSAKYYHIGLRNPWRMSFDQCTGDLYIGDVGQNDWEEVDVATAAAGPLNFGWPVREGLHPQPAYHNDCPDGAGPFVDPIAEYDHDEGLSVTGGHVYRGSAIPELRGWYFYADYDSGAIYMARAVDGALVEGPIVTDMNPGSPATFGLDANGEVYASDYHGTIYRIESAQ